MSKLNKHSRGGNSGAHYSQGGQSPNQIAPIIAAAGKMLLPILKKKGAELISKKGGELLNKKGSSSEETASTTPPTLDGGGSSISVPKASDSFDGSSYKPQSAVTRKGSPVLQKKDAFNDFNVSSYQAKIAQNQKFIDDFGAYKPLSGDGGAFKIPERQTISLNPDPNGKPQENPTNTSDKPNNKDYSSQVSQNNVTSNKAAGGYGEFANNRRGGGMDGRPMSTGAGRAFESLFGKEAVNVIREKSRMRKEARNEIRRGDISGITGSGYDETIGEGKNLFKLRKTQQRLENKKARKGDKFRGKMGLETLSGKDVNITNDKGEVTSTGQAYTRGIGEGLSDGSNTYMKRGLKATRSQSTGLGGEFAKNSVTASGNKNASSKSAKNNADVSKLNTFTPFDKDRMDTNAAKPKDMLSSGYKFGDNFFNSMKNKSNQKLSLSKDKPTSNSKPSVKTDSSVKLDYQFGQSLNKDPKKSTFFADKTSKPSDNKNSIDNDKNAFKSNVFNKALGQQDVNSFKNLTGNNKGGAVGSLTGGIETHIKPKVEKSKATNKPTSTGNSLLDGLNAGASYMNSQKKSNSGNKNSAAASNPESVSKQSRKDYLTSGINPNKKNNPPKSN